MFPLLVKLLDANMDLSVQVHPDDDYAKLHENGDLGKTVITIPHIDKVHTPEVKEVGNAEIIVYVQSDYFSVYKWKISGRAAFPSHQTYLLGSVLSGSGRIINNGIQYECNAGSHFVLPAHFGEFSIEGTCEFMISHP
ncbi:putative mannose-6-phosphate isomerase GmuF [Bacillus subtilis]|nr:Mannose-6-phosphate isomerase [Bacillus subtilis subsp. subtilis]BAI84099.1 hypothetical protein BSNT_06952 [Bacillus subtilis subsp. natto BEST195]BDB91852.1 hypothetical protein BSG8_06040 [Bacillus subtilis subsp. natto]BEH04600.1 hypothetical protein BSNN_06330 [Bacillus subtilis subsp. natto]GAK82423.1 phosphohexomutase [Bacillus subtilis Miyagi-4]